MNEKKILLSCTVGEFIEALKQGLGLAFNAQEEETTALLPTTLKKNYVYGLKGLAALLGCSLSTAARIKKSGVLDAAIVQHGKIIVIDADLALDLLKARPKKHGVRGGYKK